MIAEVLGILLGATTLTTLVAGGLAWYNGSRARREEERADAAEAAVGALVSVNAELRLSLDRVIAATAARNEREAQDDARTVEQVGSDAGRAAELLNGLHQDHPGPDPR